MTWVSAAAEVTACSQRMGKEEGIEEEEGVDGVGNTPPNPQQLVHSTLPVIARRLSADVTDVGDARTSALHVGVGVFSGVFI
ncbi:hypothetical protein EYF80_048433 [Liparis tanakae]|uniref:Uncharacterized protein n=1 Tax=Liparis tanakae TaxID=230148 RepID=A0A4Z2FJM5_9TELE|nr:hypothetical protein EYF80_048433 [Liparis tanakae]